MLKIYVLTYCFPAGDVEKVDRHPEFDVFFLTRQSEDFDRRYGSEGVYHIPNHDLRCRCAGCDSDDIDIMEPFRPNFPAIGDEMRWNASFDPNLAESIGIGAVRRSDHKYDVYQLGEFEQGSLAILRRIANVLCTGAYDVLKAAKQGCDDAARIVDAKRSLRHVRDRGVLGKVQGIDVFFGLYQQDRAWNLSQRTLDFRMAGMADQDDGTPLSQVVAALRMHFRDEWTGRIEHTKASFGRLGLDLFCDAVGTKNRYCIRRYFRKVFYKVRPTCLECVDHAFIVHDLVAHINRRPILVERPFDNLDRANDARTKPARFSENHPHTAPPFILPFPDCRRRCARSVRKAISAG